MAKLHELLINVKVGQKLRRRSRPWDVVEPIPYLASDDLTLYSGSEPWVVDVADIIAEDWEVYD